MERTMMQSTEDTVEEMKSVPLDPDPKDSNPNSGSDPNPKHVVGALSTSNGPEVNAAAGGKELDSEPKDAAVVDSELADGSKNKKSVRWSQELVMETQIPRESDRETGNPYVNYSPASSENRSSFNFKDTMDTVKDVLGRWGKRMGEATKKAEDFAGNTWQHLKTSPSLTDAALGRIAQGTKVIAEGGYEKIFQQTFETVAEEKLVNSFACYLSTSAGPVIGVLYVSTSKLAFCSDNPLSYQAGDKTEWSYYKVVVPLHQLKAVNPSTSTTNPAEKYIQVISIDNHEFWYMGFLNYNGAVECLRNSLLPPSDQSV